MDSEHLFELGLKLLNKMIKFLSSDEVKSVINVTNLIRNIHYFSNKNKDNKKD